MKKIYFLLSFIWLSVSSFSQIPIFEEVPFYSMYHYLGEGESLPAEAYSQIPEGAIRLHGYERDIISRKLTDEEIALIGDDLELEIIIKAACDNYDRLAGVNLAFTPKGTTSYEWGQSGISRIEIGRFITPFMNKNKYPNQVPYLFDIAYLIPFIKEFSTKYDIWVEFRVDGYSAAANTEVAGCAGRTDVFIGSLWFNTYSEYTGNTPSLGFHNLNYRGEFNNYRVGASDAIGVSKRTYTFNFDEPLEEVTAVLIMSNHGANSGGEEYVRRQHNIYFDGQQVLTFKPGGKSCEPYRQYNTQWNGIYGSSPRTESNWASWNNWCPGDVIPTRFITIGSVSAGTHTFVIDVPTAQFKDGQGNFPHSIYFTGKKTETASSKDFEFSAFQIFPNPANDFLKIESEVNLATLTLYNTLGQQVVQTQKQHILIAHLQKGVYIAELLFENGGKAVRKIVKN